MKTNTHPTFYSTTVACSCGNTFPTYSTRKNLRVEICSNCHPFYTGKAKPMGKEGQVEKFNQRYAKATKVKEKD